MRKTLLQAVPPGVAAQGLESSGALKKYPDMQSSIDIFEKLQEELKYDYDMEFVQKGYLMMAYTEKEWEQFKENVEVQHRLGVNAVICTPGEAKQIVPALNTEGMYGATYNSRDGHANPFHTTRAYLKAFERLGGQVNCFTEVTGIEESSGRITKVKTDKGDISTPVAVNAAGPWAAPVAAMVGLEAPCTPNGTKSWLPSLSDTCLTLCSCLFL